MKLGVLISRVRVEEKWIFEALDKRGVDYDRIDDREAIFDISQTEKWRQYDAVLERSISYARGLYATQILNAWGVPTVNMSHVAAVCGDKLTTTLALQKAGADGAVYVAGGLFLAAEFKAAHLGLDPASLLFF